MEHDIGHKPIYTVRADLMQHPAFNHLDEDSDGNPCVWENHYECDECGQTWTDMWSCQCDDECPVCACDTSPHESMWAGPETPYLRALWDGLPEVDPIIESDEDVPAPARRAETVLALHRALNGSTGEVIKDIRSLISDMCELVAEYGHDAETVLPKAPEETP